MILRFGAATFFSTNVNRNASKRRHQYDGPEVALHFVLSSKEEHSTRDLVVRFALAVHVARDFRKHTTDQLGFLPVKWQIH